jgi:ASPIC and UnbV
LGKSTQAESVEVRWPSGQRQVFHDVSADKFYLIQEGREQLILQQFVHKAPAARAYEPVAGKVKGDVLP